MNAIKSINFFSILKKRGTSSDLIPILRMIILFVISLSFISGCINKKVKVIIPVNIKAAFTDSGEQDIPGKWWTVFEDQRLNKFIENALESNLDIKIAWERLRAAEAITGYKSSALFPDLTASMSGETGRTNSAGYNDLQLSLTSEYEVDLWGRISSGIDAQKYQVHASFTDYQTVALSISAEITRAWFKLVETKLQIKLIDEQIDINRKMLSLIKVRVGSGQIRSVDILRQKKLIESTRGQKITWETRARILQHQLSVLIGNHPGKNDGLIIGNLPDLSPLPKTGIPSELIQRRPDVKSAFYRVKSADHSLASAISNLYPRLSLTASASSTTGASNNFLKNWARSLVGNLLAPIFNGGRLRAEVDRSRAVKKQLLYEYGQIILKALQEVEDALILEKKQVEKIWNLEEQIILSRKTYEQLRIEYFNGISNYLDVLMSIRDEQQLRRGILSENMLLLEYRIVLYRALAGGFVTKRESKNVRKYKID